MEANENCVSYDMLDDSQNLIANHIDGNPTDEFRPLLKKADEIVHLAAVKNGIESMNNSNMYYDMNYLSTQCICDNFEGDLIFTSSIASDFGLTPYGIFKEMESQMLIEKTEKFKSLSIYQLYNVFGEGDECGVIPIFIKNALENEPLKVYGRDLYRNFIYVKDVVNNLRFDDNYGRLHDENISIYDLARLIKDMVGSKSKIHIIDHREGDVIDGSSVGEFNSNINLEFGFFEGLRRTVKYWKDKI